MSGHAVLLPSMKTHLLRIAISRRFALLAMLATTGALLALATGPAHCADAPAWAPPTVLEYDGKGLEQGFLSYSGTGTLQWSHDSAQYQARLEITAFGLRLRTWNSSGKLGNQGLQPEHFEDTTRSGQWNTRFLRDKGVISFSSGSPDQPLQADAQDKLSALLQLGAIVSADPQHYSNGESIHFQAADAHQAERWEFHGSAPETLQLAAGESLVASKFTKEPTPEFNQKIEVWLAPVMAYLPVRMRITESSGSFVDLLWHKPHKPD